MLPILAFSQLTLFAAVPIAAQECKPDGCIRIGSYNIKLFAKSGPANTEGEIDQLANRIAHANQGNLDVVVLEEINKNGENWTGAKGLRAKLLERGYAVAFEGTFGGEDPGRPQFVILLHRTKTISLVAGSGEEIAIPTKFEEGTCKYESLRPPATALFKSANGKFSFRIIGVHLKSQGEVGNDPECDDKIRTFQGKRIVDHIAKLMADKGETNVITVGDFNAAFDAKEYDAFRQAGFESLIKGDCSEAKRTECSYLGNPNPPYYTPPGLIDHIVVPSTMKEAVKGSGTIAPFGNLQTYLATQSDHVPVWASFRID